MLNSFCGRHVDCYNDLTVEHDITRTLNANVRDSPCYKSVYSDDPLKAARSATYNHLHK